MDAYLHLGDDDTEWWMIVTKHQDGTLHVYALPSCTFENLAVEYGLDPDDIDELLRVAILQLHIPHPALRSNAPKDVAAVQGMLREGKPVALGNADSTAQAREAHLARISWVEQNVVQVVMPVPGRRIHTEAADLGLAEDVDPSARLAELKATYQPDPARMAATRDRLALVLGRRV
ncbi:hypothetical protein [Nonomuraea endophytica]|uniref:hypothetical protein n=1 Tax=Nonomuraea endophytica TaxID=714136 RepID=UPI0037C4FE01